MSQYSRRRPSPTRADAAQARRRKFRRRRIVVASVLAVLVGIMSLVTAAYLHLTSNLKTTALTAGGGEHHALSAGQPMNILVLGSDNRTSASNCDIGHDCPATTTATGVSVTGNADVEMLVHLSADRKHVQVVSIPRDTVVDIPQCTDAQDGKVIPAHRERINSTLNFGPNCTAATVHQLTGLPIDHFAVVDFSGTIKLSQAVGGVQVCVDNNVYDPYSHLKLSKGEHTLVGMSALQFLRTRHGFGDGSDLGRTAATHLFLSSLLRSMTAASTLLNPVKVYNIADAATSSLLVDPELGSVAKLAQLGYEFSGVPTSGTQMITIPTLIDPQDTSAVLLAPAAASLWADLAADRPIGSATSPTTSPSASPSPSQGRTSTASPSSDGPTATPVTAAEATGCAQVSTYKTVQIGGVAMTPIEAYVRSPKVPVSAP